MDSNTNLVSLAQQFSGLPMEDLIGGPLNAAAKANAAMALTQTRFLLETCFSCDAKTKSYTPIMIEMSLERPALVSKDGKTFGMQTVKTQFNLPLLTVIPINSLGVDNVTIDFEMEVKSSYSETENTTKEDETKAEATLEGKLGWGPLSVSIKGTAVIPQKILRHMTLTTKRATLQSIQ